MSSYFPEDIILNILSRIQLKTIFRFRCVCKSWCKLLSHNNHEFVKMHLHNHVIQTNDFSLLLCDHEDTKLCLYSIIDYESLPSSSSPPSSSSSSSYEEKAVNMMDYPFKSQGNYPSVILGSCNGLVCINYDLDVICIWNPCTKEYKELPEAPPIENRTGYFGEESYGFGHVSKIEDYKLVKILGVDSIEFSDVSVYSLGANSWKRLSRIPYHLGFGRVSGIPANEALHWIATRQIRSKTMEVIVSFHIGDEKFQEVQLPNCFYDKESTDLGALGGSLCVLDDHLSLDHVDVWVMKDYGVIESWTKMFKVMQPTDIQCTRSIQSLENGRILFQSSFFGEDTEDALVLYEPKHERAIILKMRGIPRTFDTETYVPSLVSLNSDTYVGQEQIE